MDQSDNPVSDAGRAPDLPERLDTVVNSRESKEIPHGHSALDPLNIDEADTPDLNQAQTTSETIEREPENGSCDSVTLDRRDEKSPAEENDDENHNRQEDVNTQISSPPDRGEENSARLPSLPSQQCDFRKHETCKIADSEIKPTDAAKRKSTFEKHIETDSSLARRDSSCSGSLELQVTAYFVLITDEIREVFDVKIKDDTLIRNKVNVEMDQLIRALMDHNILHPEDAIDIGTLMSTTHISARQRPSNDGLIDTLTPIQQLRLRSAEKRYQNMLSKSVPSVRALSTHSQLNPDGVQIREGFAHEYNAAVPFAVSLLFGLFLCFTGGFFATKYVYRSSNLALQACVGLACTIGCLIIEVTLLVVRSQKQILFKENRERQQKRRLERLRCQRLAEEEKMKVSKIINVQSKNDNGGRSGQEVGIGNERSENVDIRNRNGITRDGSKLSGLDFDGTTSIRTNSITPAGEQAEETGRDRKQKNE